MKTLKITLLLLFAITANAQTIEKFSIDSGGASIAAGAIEVLYTIGEVNVQELSATTIFVSEGFINSNDQTALSIVENEILHLNIYPNPVKSVININSSLTLHKIELYDVLGKQVLSTKKTTQINVETLPSGIYFLKVFLGKGNVTRKIIKK